VLNGATVTIASGYASAQDSLSFTTQTAISGSWDPGSGTLTLAGVATLAQYQAALRSVTYSNSSTEPSSVPRTINYQVKDDKNLLSAVATSTVDLTPVHDSYVATPITSGAVNNLQMENASKSFYHDGHWWAVLPDGNQWRVHEFSGTLPATGQQGGWSLASPVGALKDNTFNADVQWDEAHQKLYVLQWSKASSTSWLTKLGYDGATNTFATESTIQLGGSGGKLTGAHWANNMELVLGLDQNGSPLVASIGPSTSRGLHLAYANDDLSQWSDITLDSQPVNDGGNSKADIISYTQNGVNYIGVSYSSGGPQDTVPTSSDAWKFASMHSRASRVATVRAGRTRLSINPSPSTITFQRSSTGAI